MHLFSDLTKQCQLDKLSQFSLICNKMVVCTTSIVTLSMCIFCESVHNLASPTIQTFTLISDWTFLDVFVSEWILNIATFYK